MLVWILPLESTDNDLSYLSQVWISTQAACLWVGNDDLHPWEQLAGLHDTQTERAALLHQCDAVVPQRTHVNVHHAAVGGWRTLDTEIEQLGVLGHDSTL